MENQESLNLNDLKLMAQIIKVVSTRGAIQAEEMAAVGILYTKLLSFIKAAQPEEKLLLLKLLLHLLMQLMKLHKLKETN